MRSIEDLIAMIDEPGARASCQALMRDHGPRFAEAWGSSHNHQAWPGGYLDHVRDTMNIALALHETLSGFRFLPFSISDALLVLFLHDIEKPWKHDYRALLRNETYEAGVDPLKSAQFEWNKRTRAIVRNVILDMYDIELTPEQLNAMRFVEGEGNDYTSSRRVMNELAAFCHMCDVASARIFHSKEAF
jgi:hypothetical protein